MLERPWVDKQKPAVMYVTLYGCKLAHPIPKLYITQISRAMVTLITTHI